LYGGAISNFLSLLVLASATHFFYKRLLRVRSQRVLRSVAKNTPNSKQHHPPLVTARQRSFFTVVLLLLFLQSCVWTFVALFDLTWLLVLRDTLFALLKDSWTLGNSSEQFTFFYSVISGMTFEEAASSALAFCRARTGAAQTA
jgi:hypothetical protein